MIPEDFCGSDQALPTNRGWEGALSFQKDFTASAASKTRPNDGYRQSPVGCRPALLVAGLR